MSDINHHLVIFLIAVTDIIGMVIIDRRKIASVKKAAVIITIVIAGNTVLLPVIEYRHRFRVKVIISMKVENQKTNLIVDILLLLPLTLMHHRS